MRRLFPLLAILLLVAAPAWGQFTSQTRFLANTVPPLTSAANTAVSHTITGVSGVRVRLYSVTARCSAGSAAVTVTDGGTTVFTETGFIGVTWSGLAWVTPYTATLGATVIVTVGTCGVGNTSTLVVQADQSTP